MNQMLSELNRRNVTRVALLYAGVSWLLIQIAETVLPIFDVPTEFLRVLIIVLLLGFVVAVILAWFYDITPDGVRPDDPAIAFTHSRTSVRGMNLAIGLVLVAAALAFVSNQVGWFKLVDDIGPASAGLNSSSLNEVSVKQQTLAEGAIPSMGLAASVS